MRVTADDSDGELHRRLQSRALRPGDTIAFIQALIQSPRLLWRRLVVARASSATRVMRQSVP